MIIVLVAALSAAAHFPSGTLAADTPQHAIQSFYGALQRDDASAYHHLTSASFYAFDVGKRFAGPALFEMVRGVHASGTVLEWNLGPVDVHVHGSVAWAAWENHGSVGSAKGLQPMSWLESAALHRSGKHWVLDFLHSNRAEAAR